MIRSCCPQTCVVPPGLVDTLKQWLPTLWVELERTNKISEETLDAMGLPKDSMSMCTSPNAPWRWRACLICGEALRAMRKLIRERGVAKRQRAEAEAANKHAGVIELNRQAEAEVLLAKGIITVAANLSKKKDIQEAARQARELMADDEVAAHLAAADTATAHFDAIGKGDKCSAFSKARDKEYKPMDNRAEKTQQAFDARKTPVLEAFKPAALRGGDASVDGGDDGVPRPRGQPVVTTATLQWSRVDALPRATTTAAQLVKNPEWRCNAAHSFPRAEARINDLDTDVKIEKAAHVAEALLTAVRPRYTAYVTTSDRFKNDKQRNARIWKFGARQLPSLCALAAVQGHVGTIEEVTAKGPSETLLRLPGHLDFQRVAAFEAVPADNPSISDLQGAYLHFSDLLYKWIRAGSVSGGADRTFKTRNQEHAKGADLADDASLNSKFYQQCRSAKAAERYPHSPDSNAPRCTWETTGQFVAVGFQHADDDAKIGLMERLTADLDDREAAAAMALDDATSALADAEEQHAQCNSAAPANQARTGNKRAASSPADEPADKDARRSNRLAGRHAGGIVAPAGRVAPADPELEEASRRAVAAAKKAVAEAQKDLGDVSAELQKVHDKLEAAHNARSRALAVAKLFTWGDDEFDVYLHGKKWGSRDYLQKQLGVVAYLCEMLYDLMIAEADNVSRSPGCEALLSRGGQ